MVLRRCSKCGTDKPDDAFYKSILRSGRMIKGWCKICHSAAVVRRQKERRPELNAQARERYKKPETRDKKRAEHRYWKYGITVERLEQLRVEQAGRCAICSENISGKKEHVDHDHKTKRVRGLLCPACNHGLGNFQDNPVLLTSAISYLRRV